MVSSLKNLFPGKSKGVGIELAADRISLAQLKKQGQGFKLITLSSVPVPDGLFHEGQITDAAGMAELIQSLLAENKIKAKRVATAVTGGRDTVTRIIPIPAELNDQELRRWS